MRVGNTDVSCHYAFELSLQEAKHMKTLSGNYYFPSSVILKVNFLSNLAFTFQLSHTFSKSIQCGLPYIITEAYFS